MSLLSALFTLFFVNLLCVRSSIRFPYCVMRTPLSHDFCISKKVRPICVRVFCVGCGAGSTENLHQQSQYHPGLHRTPSLTRHRSGIPVLTAATSGPKSVDAGLKCLMHIASLFYIETHHSLFLLAGTTIPGFCCFSTTLNDIPLSICYTREFTQSYNIHIPHGKETMWKGKINIEGKPGKVSILLNIVFLHRWEDFS